MWNDATRMNSTWRSVESNGYCDLHRRGFDDLALCGIATRLTGALSDGRRNDVCELGDRFSFDGDGVNRGNVLVLGRFASSGCCCGNAEVMFSYFCL